MPTPSCFTVSATIGIVLSSLAHSATSPHYTEIGTAETVSGISASAHYITKHGFIGQLYDVVGLEVLAEPGTVGEGAERQLVGKPVLDDGTTFALLASDVNWSVVNGPVTGITAAGLASAATVFADTTAVVQGQWRGFTDTFPLQVQNVSRDDFGSYAGDGLEDDWQVQFFGLNNPEAAPGLDPDGDGQNNRFEFLAGVVPTDQASRFRWRLELAAAPAGVRQLVFSPYLADRIYTIRYTQELSGTSLQWETLLPNVNDVMDVGQERRVLDATSSGEAKRYYKMEIEKP